MAKRMTAAEVKKHLAKCRGLGDYLDLTRDLFNEGNLKAVRDVSNAAIQKFEKRYQCLYDNLGVCEWLLDEKTRAIEAWATARRTTYGPAAGHMQTHLMLWFAGVMKRDQGLVEWAAKYLERDVASLRGVHWPGPIAKYVLERATEEEVLVAANCEDLYHNIDKNWRLAQLYLGVKAFLLNDLDRAKVCFFQCANKLSAVMDSGFMNELRLAEYEWKRLIKKPSNRPNP